MSVKRAKAVKASLGKQHHHDSARARGRTSKALASEQGTGARKPPGAGTTSKPQRSTRRSPAKGAR